jgi:hypothetical protein
MVSFDDLAGAKRALAVGDIRNANRSRNYAYAYPFNFSAVAAAGSASVTQKITAAAAFVVASTTGMVHDGTGVTVTSNLITVELSANDGQWQQAAVAWPTIIGTAVQPYYWLFRPTCAPGANVVITIRNNTAAAITGSITLIGHHLSAN